MKPYIKIIYRNIGRHDQTLEILRAYKLIYGDNKLIGKFNYGARLYFDTLEERTEFYLKWL